MRALLITLEGVKEVQMGVEVEKLDALLDDRTFTRKDEKHSNLASMYRHIGCNTVTGAGYPDEHHAAWVDDNALLTLQDGDQVTQVDWYPEYLLGKILVTGFDPKTGNTTEATMTAKELETRIIMIGKSVGGSE